MAKDLEKKKNDTAKGQGRKPPRVGMEWPRNDALELGTSGDWTSILRASGNVTVANGLIMQAAILGSCGKRTDPEATDFVVGFVDSMEPRDAAEALLLTQMAATHQATMMLARQLNHVENIPQKDCAERALNKAARTFAAQMDTLKRYRSKGQQVVRVERVTVESGAQAVVGTVESGGRGSEEK
ncbi:hypothetical protein AB0T83_18820 [Fluviibacterium sp. DFM31]|uniref:Uncharacterized protein n=1 Tax=Meridianimarinicoccus marinus TaxID=3231483 RepID=A0ABV3LB90_9RHOB